MLMFGVNEAISQLIMASSVHRYGQVLRKEDDHALGMVLV